MRKMALVGMVAFGLAIGTMALAGAPKGGGAATKDIADTVAATDNLKTLTELIKVAGLSDQLKGTDRLTLFAPTDDAFAALPKDKLDALKKDPAALKALLLNHVSTIDVGPRALPAAGKIKTLGTLELTAAKSDDAKAIAMVNDAKVTLRVAATNGRIYILDKVILPPEPAAK